VWAVARVGCVWGAFKVVQKETGARKERTRINERNFFLVNFPLCLWGGVVGARA
jgi:hypothetical protein